MKIFGIHLHNWVNVHKATQSTYLGQPMHTDIISHRYCPECGQAQERRYTHLSRFYWQPLTEQQTLILNSLTFVKEGTHYVRIP